MYRRVPSCPSPFRAPSWSKFDLRLHIEHLLFYRVPESQAVLKASNQGIPVILDEQSDAGQAYSDATDRLLGKDIPHRFLEVQKKGFLKRMFGGKE